MQHSSEGGFTTKRRKSNLGEENKFKKMKVFRMFQNKKSAAPIVHRSSRQQENQRVRQAAQRQQKVAQQPEGASLLLEQMEHVNQTNYRHLDNIGRRKSRALPPKKEIRIIEEEKSTPLETAALNGSFSFQRKTLVASKGCYNLSQYVRSSTIEEEDTTLVDISANSLLNSTPSTFTDDLDTVVEDESTDGTYSYMDFYKHSIEPIHKRNPQFVNNYSSRKDILQLTRKMSHANLNTGKPSMIFEMPELVERILMLIEDDIVLPVEHPPARRKPLSFEHAKLMYNDENLAKSIWATESETLKDFQKIKQANRTIYSCLLVNRLWHSIAKKLFLRRLFFRNDDNFQKLIGKLKLNDAALKESFKTSNTKVLLLHRLKGISQDQINLLANNIIANGNNLEWIEMYICPSVYPPISLFTSNNLLQSGPFMLKNLILAGSDSKKINNFFLKIVATNCPNLEKLDLRICEYYSDAGLIEISRNCSKIHYLNIGRFKNCDKITDSSVCAIIKNCTSLRTLGCAGCSITDITMWALAQYQSSTIERLSLNNCFKLSNDSIPRILEQNYLPSLQVLEIRNITSLTDFRPIIDFRKRKSNNGEYFLIENCETLEKRMKEQEFQIDLEISKRMLNDIASWCHDPNDGDADYKLLFNKN